MTTTGHAVPRQAGPPRDESLADDPTPLDYLLLAAARLLTPGRRCVAEAGLPAAAVRVAGAVPVGQDLRHALRHAETGVVTAAQVDVMGNLNRTALGELDEPDRLLDGPGLLPDVVAALPTLVLLRHRIAAFVERVDVVTAPGALSGPLDRAQLGLRGTGPIAVVTDLGVLRPDPATARLVLTDVHPGVTVEQVWAETGWPLEVSDEVVVTPAPTAAERAALRGSTA